MVKKQTQKQGNQSNKGHKTLRDKLRKKRQQLKNHKKQKNEKHKQYDPQEQKKKFFQQTNSKKKKRQDGIKQHKLKKHIEKFVDIYEDDVQDFYQLFGTLDQGGSLDISGVADPKMQKCLKKMFKYLPLNKKKFEYSKKPQCTTKLRPLMTQLVSKSIQNYLQNGTDVEKVQQSQKQSSDDNQQLNQKKNKSNNKNQKQKKKQILDKQQQKIIKSRLQNQALRQYERLRLYPQRNNATQANTSGCVGPFISADQRQYLAKMFEEQLQKGINNQQNLIDNQKQKQEDDQFQRIFSMSTQKQPKNNKGQPKANIDDLPQDLLAEGSAKLGEKQEIDPDYIEQYNKIHRPRKLIQQHQQMRKLGKYAETDQNGKKKRVPFDRERDIVNGRSRNFMNNGVFFDFKQRMSKPKGQSNFL